LKIIATHTNIQATEKKRKKKVLLDEHDFLWPKLRHMHIADSISWILKSFHDFVRTNKISNLNKQNETGVNGLRAINKAMKEMPQYQEMFAKYSLHIRLANECMNVFRGKELSKIALIEQNLATGTDTAGKTIKKGSVTADVQKFLSDGSISKEDKMRLFLIYLLSQEGDVKPKDKEKMMSSADFNPRDRETIENATNLGIGLSKTEVSSRYKKTKDNKKKKINEDDVPYDVSRWVPVLKEIVSSMIDDTLPTDEFLYLGAEKKIREEGGQKKAKSLKTRGGKERKDTWADDTGDSKGKQKLPENAPRVIVFIAGGMTYSEMRAMYELSLDKECEVTIGSTSVLTPNQFLAGLKNLAGQGGAKNRVSTEEGEEEESD